MADADQQHFEHREWGLKVFLLGHFSMCPHVGHTRRIRPVFPYRITDLEAQIKTKSLTIALLCNDFDKLLRAWHGSKGNKERHASNP